MEYGQGAAVKTPLRGSAWLQLDAVSSAMGDSDRVRRGARYTVGRGGQVEAGRESTMVLRVYAWRRTSEEPIARGRAGACHSAQCTQSSVHASLDAARWSLLSGEPHRLCDALGFETTPLAMVVTRTKTAQGKGT